MSGSPQNPKSRPNKSLKSSPFKKPLVHQPRQPLDILQYKLEVMEDIQSQDMSRSSKDMSRSPLNQKLVQINYLNPGYIIKYYWETLRTFYASRWTLL